MEISIIIINFNSLSFLKKCLKSIEEKISNYSFLKKIEIIVVNNEKEALILKNKTALKIIKIENKANLGFGRACNIGAKKAKGKYLFFLNPDTELLSQDFSLILNKFKTNPTIGIIGTKIIEENKKTPQPWTCGKKTSLLRILFKNSINKPWNKKRPVVVDWVSGSSLFIERKDFQALDGFDEKFFMYFEDQDLCLRLKKRGKSCLFFPNFSILHHNGKSWNNENQKKTTYYQSQAYFFKKHFGRFQSSVFIFTKKLLNK